MVAELTTQETALTPEEGQVFENAGVPVAMSLVGELANRVLRKALGKLDRLKPGVPGRGPAKASQDKRGKASLFINEKPGWTRPVLPLGTLGTLGTGAATLFSLSISSDTLEKEKKYKERASKASTGESGKTPEPEETGGAGAVAWDEDAGLPRYTLGVERVWTGAAWEELRVWREAGPGMDACLEFVETSPEDERAVLDEEGGAWRLTAAAVAARGAATGARGPGCVSRVMRDRRVCFRELRVKARHEVESRMTCRGEALELTPGGVMMWGPGGPEVDGVAFAVDPLPLREK